MSKKKNKTPPVCVTLPRENFNAMMWVLTRLVKSEVTFGRTDFVNNAEKLRNKILRYARPYVNDGRDYAAVYFYEIEAAVLIELLIFFTALAANDCPDVFGGIKKSWEEKRKRKKSVA